MVSPYIDRRKLIAGIGALAAVPKTAFAEDYIDLQWSDLIPEGQTSIPPILQSLIDHDQAPISNQQPQSNGVRTDWNGQIVRLPGFVLPVDYSGTGVTAFILVPFVGACVHVPPPPANQLVFVTTEVPYETAGLYEPVSVIGMFGVSSISTHLADIGYALSAERIEPYET
jgi:hypothetical protein